MPIMIVGADTGIGRPIVEHVVDSVREVRAFVSDSHIAAELKALGVKTALGDVSDDSHVGAACTNVFTAVLVGEAAEDARERSFASTPAAVLAAWSRAVSGAGVRRVLWVGVSEPPDVSVPEVAVVATEGPIEEIVRTVASLDASGSIRDP